jgi:hypothetical protein
VPEDITAEPAEFKKSVVRANLELVKGIETCRSGAKLWL